MNKVTICFCVKEGQVLLALKLTGKIGVGNLNGYGGGVELTDPSVVAGAVRELDEECKIQTEAQHLALVAHIEFRFDGSALFEGFVYLVREWSGTPVATDEMGEPAWYPIDTLPIEQMWEGDRLWLPNLLTGEILDGWIDYEKVTKEILGYEFWPTTVEVLEQIAATHQQTA
jgi:ADP-ribose pyrophosphatase YjhB (NUDIX family)